MWNFLLLKLIVLIHLDIEGSVAQQDIRFGQTGRTPTFNSRSADINSRKTTREHNSSTPTNEQSRHPQVHTKFQTQTQLKHLHHSYNQSSAA